MINLMIELDILLLKLFKALIKNVDDEASKKLAADLILILKDIYD